VTFSGETTSGWQTASFSQPVAIQANTVYLVSYYAPVGHYPSSEGFFLPNPSPVPDGSDSVDSPPLHALRATGATTNGVYSYAASTTFPTSTFNGENYWVDPVFSPSPPPGQPTAVTGSAGFGSVVLSWSAPATGGTPTSYVVTPFVGSSPQPPTTVSGSPAPTSATVTGLSNGTTYTFTVTAVNPNGSSAPSAASAPLTPSAAASLVQNGAFESALSFWTPGGVANPVASTARAHAGTGSALLGTSSGSEPLGDSSLSQVVGVPVSGTTTLSFWYWPQTSDGICTTGCQYDWQQAEVRSTSGTTLASIFKSNSNAQAWTQVTFNLTAYAGQTVVLWFNVHEDGAVPADDTAMYLDDVSVSNSQPTPPGAPTGVKATAGNASATVSWTAPSTGGSPITGYTVTPYIGTTPQPTVSAAASATSANVTGLANGTAYTFTVTATNAIGVGLASAPSAAVTPAPPSVPGSPTNVTATAGNTSATVSWTAPADGGSALTKYTVTPYIGSTPQPTTTVSGAPPATSTIVTGLTNATAYTFTVSASNAIGTGAASAASNAATPNPSVPPAFVQRASAHSGSAAILGATTPGTATSGDRVIVETGSWSPTNATVTSVTDSAGNTYVKLKSLTAPDGTELAIWSAPITAGGGTALTVTAHATATTDLGISVAEYSGLSLVNDATVADQIASASGTTSSASTVASGATAATTAGNELAVGFYVDSGFDATLAPSASFTSRVNVSPVGDMEMLVQDQLVGAGATPNATVGTSASTPWAMATVVFKSGAPPVPTPPAAPTGVTASAGNGNATVSWTAPANGGSAITSYTVTPFAGTTPLAPATLTGAPPATTTTVTGLTNGTSYTFSVTATNTIGTGPSSAASNTVTPAPPAVPAAPGAVTATAGTASAAVSWTAPANGGSAITSYIVTPYSGATALTPTTLTGSPPATTISVTGLTNGTAYTFTVRAANAIGTGPESAPSNSVTPSTAPPLAIDTSVSKDGAGTLTSPALTTASPGELLVVFVELDGPGGTATQSATVAGGGLTWTMAKRTNTQAGDSEVWWARPSGTVSAVAITATPLKAGYDGALTVVAFRGAGGVGTSASAAATTGAPDIAVTAAAGSWVFAAGNDWDGAVARTVATGQTMVHQRVDTAPGDTFWTQSPTAPSSAAGTVHVNDTAPTNHRWNLAAVEITQA
jgi:hypothetical protein